MKRTVRTSSSGNRAEERHHSDVDSEGDLENGLGGRPDLESVRTIVTTSFDAYFTQNAGPSRTSSNVFSALLPSLSSEEYSQAIESSKFNNPPISSVFLTSTSRSILFSRFSRELGEGFNIICYGYGSKRRLLNDFATQICTKAGHVIVVNGFQPDLSLKDVLSSVEKIPGLSSLSVSTSTIDSQARRIFDFFASQSCDQRMYLVVHNIDAPPFRTEKAKSILSLLALNPRIHLTASIDRIDAPLLWSSADLSTRKLEPSALDSPLSGGFAWIWHDVTTLDSYDFELRYADRTSIAGAHSGGSRRLRAAGGPPSQNGVMTETAALHILASVTQKAQKLFEHMAINQMEAMESADDASAKNERQFAIAYDALFNAARENFIATNDTALQSLLGEFRDHGLVLSGPGASGSGEVLWIPLRKERLSKILVTLASEIIPAVLAEPLLIPTEEHASGIFT